MNKEPTRTIYGIFNKHNGYLFSFEEDKNIAYGYNEKNFLVKEIVLKPDEFFFGDYYTGKIYSVDDKQLIREDEIEENYYQGIISHYSLIKQIFLLIDVIDINKDKLKIPPQYEEFTNFVRDRKTRYEKSLEIVKNDKEAFIFLSLDDLKKICQKRLEGIV